MKFIVYTNNLENLCLTRCFCKEDIEKKLGSLTQEEYEQHCWEKSVPPTALNARWTCMEEFPKEDIREEFFDAWEDTGQKIIVNLSKAKNVQLNKIRKHRDLLLKNKYDGLLNRAQDMELSEEIIEGKRKKQELRDVTLPLKNLEPKNLQEIKDATPHLEEL
jgi:hypothetical protein